MFKIRKINFAGHPILGDLELDFRGQDGNAVDTVIIAGENGTGKSTILNVLYKIASHTIDFPIHVEFERDGTLFLLAYFLKKIGNNMHSFSSDQTGKEYFVRSDEFLNKYPFSAIFSDVDINFHAKDITSVTSLTLDSARGSRRSSSDLPTVIKQLLIDVQALDDAELARMVRANPTVARSSLIVNERMPRFTKAFNRMFSDLSYSYIKNEGGHKSIVFKKCGHEVSVDVLSSGEKQIVYRGCFLLRDVNATKGAFVFVDEPEISLHPDWQKRIMEYYKSMFTDENGVQTSQIFAVTHSPFIIHNENRKNDKVIVLARDSNGDVVVKDKPEYYKCNSIEVIEDAFAIRGFVDEKPTVYLEGRTDELYFNKALEIYGLKVPFQFKWVGYIDANGQEANTGKDALNKAATFLISRRLPVRNVCLYDCDTNKPQKEEGNVVTMSLPGYDNDKGIKIGIENALVFGDIDIEPYKKQRVEIDGYGIEKRIPDFQKMACCEHVCSLGSQKLETVLVNLKAIIENLAKLFSEVTHDAGIKK